MKIEVSQSHLFRNAAALQDACAKKLADMAVQLHGPLNAEELEAAKSLAKGAWTLVEGLFEAQGMEIKLRLDVELVIDYINDMAGA